MKASWRNLREKLKGALGVAWKKGTAQCHLNFSSRECTSCSSWAESGTGKSIHFRLEFKVWTTVKQEDNKSHQHLAPLARSGGARGPSDCSQNVSVRITVSPLTDPDASLLKLSDFLFFKVLSSFGQDPWLIFTQKQNNEPSVQSSWRPKFLLSELEGNYVSQTHAQSDVCGVHSGPILPTMKCSRDIQFGFQIQWKHWRDFSPQIFFSQ